jgi:hypothetical protein
MGSLGIYVGCFRLINVLNKLSKYLEINPNPSREERDTDELYKMDPRLATIGQKKHMIMHKINMRRQADGSDADVRDLESELLEIVVSLGCSCEEAMRNEMLGDERIKIIYLN